MDYIPLTERGDELQRNEEQIERKLHFIGKSYVCHKGGFKHEHLSKADYFSCNGEDMKTKRRQEHEQYLKDKDLQVAAEKTKLAQISATAERDLVEQRRQAKQDDKDKILRIKELELQASREQCERDDMKTKRDEEHEKNLKYLKDKDLEIASETRKTEEKRAKAERDFLEQRRQAELDINDKVLKIKEKELQVGMQQKINEERRSSNERQTMKMKHDHEIKLKKLEMEQQAKSAKLEERKIKVEETKANNMKDLLAILKHKKQSSNRGAIDSRQCERSQLHLDIEPSTSSIRITSDNDAVPSAINKYLF